LTGIDSRSRYNSEKGAVMIWDDVCRVENDPDREARNLLHEFLGE